MPKFQSDELLTVSLRFDELKTTVRVLRTTSDVLLQSYAEQMMLKRIADKLAALYETQPSDK